MKPLPEILSTHTHFFRGEEELEAAMSTLAERAKSGRLPRIWCAGCSTGAEPYTLAILCRERSIDAEIHATDVNPTTLEVAREARFPQISLRRTPEHLRSRYFTRAGSDYVVVPEIARLVTFEQGDLRTGPLPVCRSTDGDNGWDVILCRNVLIYYAREVAAEIALRLAAVLRSDGVLIVGSTDPLAFRSVSSLRLVSAGGASAYARARPEDSFEPLAAPPFFDDPALDSPLPPLAAPPSRAASPPSPADPNVARLLSAARAHIAAHAWKEAETALLEAASADPLAPDPHLYLGVLHRKQGQLEQAAEHLRRALFLSPESWIASYLLAGVWERLGDRPRACLALSRTLLAIERSKITETPCLEGDPSDPEFDPHEIAQACRTRLGRET